MFDDNDVILAAAAVVVLHSSKNKDNRPRRFWIRPSLQRSRYSGSDLMGDLIEDDVDPLNYEYRCNGGFKNFFRMSSSDFEELLNKIGPVICKSDTHYRQAIPTKERLGITLRFMASGDSYRSLELTFKVSRSSISKIVLEVCKGLVEVLKDNIKMPQNEDDWKQIEKDFAIKWNYPHCYGAMDGKHICLQAPLSSGTEFYNYKGFFSIVLLGVVDANYNFIFVDVGCQGRISDGGVFDNTSFKRALASSTLNLPPDSALVGRSTPIPSVFVADDAFPLTRNIMKPYAGPQEKGSKTRIFNYRLSRARRVAENSFGILSAVFRFLRKPLLLEPEKAEVLVLSAVSLHNYLRRNFKSSSIYTPVGSFDSECTDTGEITPGMWRRDSTNQTSLLTIRRIPRRSSTDAMRVREEFTEYFSTEQGSVSWQDRLC